MSYDNEPPGPSILRENEDGEYVDTFTSRWRYAIEIGDIMPLTREDKEFLMQLHECIENLFLEDQGFQGLQTLVPGSPEKNTILFARLFL